MLGGRNKQGPILEFNTGFYMVIHFTAPESGSDSASDDLNLDTIIPTGTNVGCPFQDNWTCMHGPGLAISSIPFSNSHVYKGCYSV